MSTLQEDVAVGNESFAKILKKEVAVKLKGEGNQIQFSLNLISRIPAMRSLRCLSSTCFMVGFRYFI
jgi:hypothetical protein